MLPPEYVQEFHGSSWAWSYLFWIEFSPSEDHARNCPVNFPLLYGGVQNTVDGNPQLLITVAYINRTVHGLFGLDQINGFLAFIWPSASEQPIRRSLAEIAKVQHTLGDSEKCWSQCLTRSIQLHMYRLSVRRIGQTSGRNMVDRRSPLPLANYEYQTIDMTWTAEYPMLIDLLTHITVLWEISYCVLIWPKLTRPLASSWQFHFTWGSICDGHDHVWVHHADCQSAFVSPGSSVVSSKVAYFVDRPKTNRWIKTYPGIRLLGDEMFRVSLRLRRDLVFDKIDDRSFALTLHGLRIAVRSGRNNGPIGRLWQITQGWMSATSSERRLPPAGLIHPADVAEPARPCQNVASEKTPIFPI